MAVLARFLRQIDRGTLAIVVLFLFLLPFANPRVYATDEVQYFVYLRSLRFDGDLDFANDYQELARLNPASGIEGSLLQPNRIRAKTGLYGNIAPVGSALMWAPFFLLADAGVQVAHRFGIQIAADGFSRPYAVSVCYASAFYGLLGLLLCRRLAAQYASPRAAALATIAIWLASPLVFYMFIQMPFAHATGFFLTSLFIAVWHQSRGRQTESKSNTARMRSWRAWACLGLIAALMTMTREQLGLFMVVVALEGATDYWLMLRQRYWRAAGAVAARHVLFVAVFLIALTPQIVSYQILNGEPRPASEVSGRINWCSPHFIDTLIDYNPAPSSWCNTVGDFTASFPPFSRGAFVWSPLVAIGLLGVLLLWPRDAMLCVVFLVIFGTQTYINGAYGTTWHLRGAFGFRRLIECTPIFVVGLSLLLDTLARRARWHWLIGLLGLFVIWNTGLVINATFFESQTHLRRIGLVWPEVWHWQAELPLKVVTQFEEIVLRRCRFLQNGRC